MPDRRRSRRPAARSPRPKPVRPAPAVPDVCTLTSPAADGPAPGALRLECQCAPAAPAAAGSECAPAGPGLTPGLLVTADAPPAVAPYAPARVPRTVAELKEEFLAYMAREQLVGRRSGRTLGFYAYYLGKWVQFVGADRPLSGLLPYDLERFKWDWHSTVAVQRLHNWGHKMFGAPSPFAGVEKPSRGHGRRERVLQRAEMARLLRAASPEFRAFLLGMRHSLARPQEVRAFRWSNLYRFDSYVAFVLTEFKSKDRRKDGVRLRIVPVDARLMRLIGRLRERQRRGPALATNQDFVFLDSRGRPWSREGVGQAMRRTCRRCGLETDDLTMRIVPYTMRHTAATQACANGVRDFMLAKLLGHTTVRTTQRYVHLGARDVAAVIEKATRARRAGGGGDNGRPLFPEAAPAPPAARPLSPAEAREAEDLATVEAFSRAHGPTRVLVREGHTASALEAAALGVAIDVILIAQDGFSLGAPAELAEAALAMGTWVHTIWPGEEAVPPG